MQRGKGMTPPPKNDTTMKRNEILDAIKMLSLSQGFYGRLYQRLQQGGQAAQEWLDEAERQNFGSPVDLVMWIEC